MPNIISQSACFITVRTRSTRLPGKTLLKIRGRTCIEHVIDRAKLTTRPERIVLTTSNLPEDDILQEIAQKNGIDWFRGSLEDKMVRWRDAARKFGVEFFSNIDADDLFYAPELMDLGLEQMAQNPNCDLIKGSEHLACSVFTHAVRTSALEKACDTKTTTDTEVYFRFLDDPSRFNVTELKIDDQGYIYPYIRMTLDYQEDFDF